MNLRLFSAHDVHRALPMSQAIEGVKAGYVQLSAGRVQAPLRTPLAVSPNDVTLIMPFFAPPAAGADGALGLKLVSSSIATSRAACRSSTPLSWLSTPAAARRWPSSRAAV